MPPERAAARPALPLPGLKLPVAGVFGRRDGLQAGAHRISSEMLKEALFLDHEVARAVTGFFNARLDGAALRLDVTDPASVRQAVLGVLRAYGGLDVLISNAGILRAAGVGTQSVGDFDAVTAVNYRG